MNFVNYHSECYFFFNQTKYFYLKDIKDKLSIEGEIWPKQIKY